MESIGLASDAMLARAWGTVDRREGYQRWRSPIPPRHFVTNCLALDAPMAAGDLDTWCQRFRAEVPDVPGCSFVWQGNDAPEAPGWRCQGIEVGVVEALPAPGGLARRLAGDADWQALALQYERLYPGGAAYGRTMLDAYRWLVDRGQAAFFGIEAEGRLVAHVGVVAGDGLRRLQWVATDPAFTRRGYCRELAATAATFGAGPLVCQASDRDPEAQAAYRSIGFRPVDRLTRLWRST